MSDRTTSPSVQKDQALSMSNLVKSFGHLRALDSLNLSVQRGEVHGFLGPNGSGKTTTIRILLGLLRADEGQISLLGADPWRDAVALHRRIAYVPGDVTLWANLTGGEIIDLLGRLRGDLNPARRAALLEIFELDTRKKAHTYSKGNRQKVALIAALASDAELLILDEPTSGLDPLMEAAFRECIALERKQGRTVLLSSHILGEVEALCDRVTIIRSGTTVETGTLAELRRFTRTVISAELSSPPHALAEMHGVHDVQTDSNKVHCTVENSELSDTLAYLISCGLQRITTQPPTLEELFLRHYRHDAIEKESNHE